MRISHATTLPLAAAPMVGRGDIHVLAILGYGAAGEADALGAEHRRKLVVGQRMARILLLDQLLTLRLSTSNGVSAPSGPFDPSEKKKRSSITPCGVCAYLLATARLTVEG